MAQKKKPKFESDNLEGQNSSNHLKEYPEVLSRLGRTGRKQRNQGFSCKTAQHKREKTEEVTRKKKLRNVDWKGKIRKNETDYTGRHFVQEGKREYQKNCSKV